MAAATKYRSKRTALDNYSFASKFEAYVYSILKLRQKTKEITDLQCQTQVELTKARIIYKPDFKFFDLSQELWFWVEAKGFETPEWRIKKRLWEYYGLGPLIIYYGSHSRIAKTETVYVKE